MKTYWPCGRAMGQDGRIQPLTTYSAFISLGEARKQIDLWHDWYKYDMIEAWVDVYEKGKLIQKIPIIEPKQEMTYRA